MMPMSNAWVRSPTLMRKESYGSNPEFRILHFALQQEFADFVTQVDKLRFDVQQQIEKLETLKQSLMQEYFG